MFELIGCDATPLPGLVDNLAVFLCFKQWTTCWEYRFRVPKHIILLEAEALVRLVRRLVGTGMRSRRVLVAVDSRVSMTALAKGLSSSHTLNYIRKQLCKLCLFAKLALELVWTPSDAPSRCGLVESLRAALVLPWRPLRISEIPSSASLGGLGSQSSRPSALPTLGRTSLALSGRHCADWYLWRLGHAHQRDPRCRLRPPDLQGRDFRLPPFIWNTHMQSSNEDAGSTSWSPLSVLGPWLHEAKQPTLACDISIFLIVQKVFGSQVVLRRERSSWSMPTNERI